MAEETTENFEDFENIKHQLQEYCFQYTNISNYNATIWSIQTLINTNCTTAFQPLIIQHHTELMELCSKYSHKSNNCEFNQEKRRLFEIVATEYDDIINHIDILKSNCKKLSHLLQSSVLEMANYDFNAENMWSVGGLLNLGNTCYANVIIQILFHCPPFVHWLTHQSTHSNDDVCAQKCVNRFSCMWYKLLIYVRTGYVGIPDDILTYIRRKDQRFMENEQHDAEEFLEALPMWLCTDQNYVNVMDAIFQFGIETKSTCLQCNYISTTTHRSMRMQLHLKNFKVANVHQLIGENYEKTINVNEYKKCTECNQLSRKTKVDRIVEYPFYLTLHLHRFFIDKVKETWCTNDCKVIAKEYLDFDVNRASNECMRYQLVAVVNHIGTTLSNGHYDTIIRDQSEITAGWHRFTDDVVTHMWSLEITLTDPVLYFYRLLPSKDNAVADTNPLQRFSATKSYPRSNRKKKN